MRIAFSKYHGTGNDFIIIDNRTFFFDKANHKLIAGLCHRRFGIGADGVLLLEPDDETDYRMIYFNADGRPGSMCGNGARCLAAYAHRLLNTATRISFSASDGKHEAEILAYNDRYGHAVVKLKMSDVAGIETINGDYVINTGSPHYVTARFDPLNTDVYAEGKKIRNSERFAEEGINVNFIRPEGDTIILRTYERGVEDETWSCGTGAVAAAIAAWHAGMARHNPLAIAARGGTLKVSAERDGDVYRNLFLEGPAKRVFDGETDI